MSNWKEQHANQANEVFKHELVMGVIEEFTDNCVRNFAVPKDDALFRYGLKKCMGYAAQVARAQALGIDPDALRMDGVEVTEAQLRLIEMAYGAGKPVFFVTDDDA